MSACWICPSASRARNAALLVCTGAELEIGWLPILLRESGNPAIQPGQPGYFEAAQHVTLLDRPARLDRADGDVHAAGNPHIQTDPHNIARVAEALAKTLAYVDPANAAYYASRHSAFKTRWNAAMVRWETQAAPLKGVPVVAQHKAYPYLQACWRGSSKARQKWYCALPITIRAPRHGYRNERASPRLSCPLPWAAHPRPKTCLACLTTPSRAC